MAQGSGGASPRGQCPVVALAGHLCPKNDSRPSLYDIVAMVNGVLMRGTREIPAPRTGGDGVRRSGCHSMPLPAHWTSAPLPAIVHWRGSLLLFGSPLTSENTGSSHVFQVILQSGASDRIGLF